MFSSLICFYLFFLYISFGTFFGQGIAPASQRGVKQCNQNMESDILRQHSLALSPWPSKPCGVWRFLASSSPMWFLKVFFYRVQVTNVEFEGYLGGQWLRARLYCRKISDSIFWLYYFTPRWLAGAMPCPKKAQKKYTKRKDRNR